MKKIFTKIIAISALFALSGVSVFADSNKDNIGISTRNIDHYDLDCYEKIYTSHGDVEADDDVNYKMTTGYSNRNHILGLTVTDSRGNTKSISCSNGSENTAKLKTSYRHLHSATGSLMS